MIRFKDCSEENEELFPFFFEKEPGSCDFPDDLRQITDDFLNDPIFSSSCSSAHFLKARSHDPFLRIRFLVPKIGSRRSDGPISRFRFCGENVGRSFAVCSHDPFFRTNKESLIWRQNDHAKFVGTSKRVSDENRACSISIRVFKITDPCDGRSFLMCSHDPFSEPTKIESFKMDRVNGP